MLSLDCRYSGWLTGYERSNSKGPATCLHFSGGADVSDGDRVVFDDVKYHILGEGYRTSGEKAHDKKADQSRGRYPLCIDKNPAGECKDFVRAMPLSWLGNFWLKLFRREWRTRKMRL